MSEVIDAVVLAGGRISGLFARLAGTRVKALVRVGGPTLLERVLSALEGVPEIERIVVVGPEAVREAAGGHGWRADRGSALDNLLAGLEALGDSSHRVLVCGADLPSIDAASVQDFVDRAPPDADLCMPLVSREDFVARFPGEAGIYVRLLEGRFTAGSQLLVRPGAMAANLVLFRRLHARRKSQLAMAGTLGAAWIGKLVRGRLSLAELERRGSELTGCRCRAVRDCRPELAHDLDTVLDLLTTRRRVQRASRSSPSHQEGPR